MSKVAVAVSIFAVVAVSAVLAQRAEASQPSPTELRTCTSVYERARQCTDVFIPALVDARIALDLPPGMAAARDNRDAIVKVALKEWKDDSTDPAIERTCRSMLKKSTSVDTASLIDASNRCLAATDCQSYVSCIIPVLTPALH